MKGAVFAVLSAVALICGVAGNNQATEICRAAGSDGVLVPHEICNRFYKCSFGEPVAIRCPSILFYDIDLERCEWPETVNCGDRQLPDADDIWDGEDWTGDGAGNDDPSQAAAICAAEGSDHVMVAHENCHWFYQCWAGTPVPLICPLDLFFDPSKDYCEYLYKVDCGDRIIPDVHEGRPPGGGDQEDPIPEGDNNDDPSQAAAICSRPDSSGVLVAHENCNQFYMCTHGGPVALICSGVLLFDPRTDRCEWPNTVNCGDRVIPEPDPNPTTWSPPLGGGNSDPSQAGAICAAEGSDNVMIAHENCNRFYQCWAGRPVPLACPSHLYFNPRYDICDFPSNVDCGNRLIPDSSDGANSNPGGDNNNVEEDVPAGGNNNDPSQAPAICRRPDSEGVLVAHENCNQFYICSFFMPIAQTCPPNLLFDPAWDRCEWANTVDCGDRVIPEPDPNPTTWSPPLGGGNNDPSQAGAICAAEGSDNVMIAHENCNQFYQCWAGRPVPLSCPEGLYFNPRYDICDFRANVDCGSRVIPEITDGENSNPGGDNNNVEDDVPAGGNNNDPSQAPAICRRPDSEGVLVAHENCNQFYICSFFMPIAQTCPPNLLFDPAWDRCEWANTVDCGDRVIPEPDPNPTTWSPPLGGGNNDPSQAGAICAAEGSDNVMIAHENCNQFYQCWAGRPVPLSCPEGLFFNPRYDICDFRANVDCANRL